MSEPRNSRRTFLSRAAAATTAVALAGCDDLSQKPWVLNLLGRVEHVTRSAQRLFAGTSALAPEFDRSEIAPVFRANGTLDPGTPSYEAHVRNGFRDWKIEIGGLVERPYSLSLAQLQALPARTQITRHDCVEGWSCIGEWAGAPLKPILLQARPKPSANYVMFYCADPMSDGPGAPTYYESLDLVEAMHPQTILAYSLNGKALPVANGAPVRLRAERQLGYKMAKYVERIEVVESFDHVRGGKGGYWEDLGYTWYAGI